MKLKLALAVTFSLGLVVVLWILIGGGPGNPEQAAIGPADVPLPGAAPTGPGRLAETPAATPEELRETVTEREPAAAAVATILGHWEGQLAGIVGRVVDSAGTPQPRLRVDLLQADWTLLVADDLRDLGSGVSLGLGHALTDAEGRFRIDGAWSNAFHGLGIDLGGQRSTLRVIDHALKHGEQTDLGDIVLGPFGVLVGKIVDEAGRPMAGARIRVGALPDEVLAVRLYDLRADSAVGVIDLLRTAQPGGLIELPGWLRKHFDALPVPTTTSGPDGTFRLEGVPLTRVVGGIDRTGFVGLPVGPLEIGETEHDLGLLTLTRGRTLTGVVLDAAGRPAPGFAAYAGAEVPIGQVALLQPCGKSDAEGRFTCVGVPPEGRAVAVARLAEGEPYAAAIAENAGELVIRVPSTVALDVRVVDAEGSPLSGARLQLTPLGEEEPNLNRNPMALLMSRTPSGRSGFREVEAGLYRRARVSFGSYELRGQVDDHATSHSRIEVGEATGVVTLTCAGGMHLALTVVDDVSGEPVPGARATVLQAGLPLVTTHALGWSDTEGRVRLGPYDLLSEEASSRSPMGTQPALLVVEHPGYPTHENPLPPPGASTIVRMKAGGAVKGLITWGGAAPELLYMIILEFRGADGVAELFHIPRLGLSGLTGEFRFDKLSAGEYRIEVFERFLGGDIVGIARDQVEPVRVHRETLEVVVGQTTELLIDLSPSGIGPSGRIVGSVRVEGAPFGGASVRIDGSREMTLLTDAWGRFDSGEIPVQRSSNVTITGDLSHYPGGQSRQLLHDERVRLDEGEVHEIDLDLAPRLLNVEVVDASTGAPVENALVVLRPNNQKTDSGGRVQLMVFQEGPHSLEAHASGYVVQHVEAASKPGVPEEVFKIELIAATPCAGRIVLSDHQVDPDGTLYLHVQREGGGDSWAYLRNGELEFSVEGLGPGTYQAQVYGQAYQSQEITFELGAGGDRNLVLRF